MGSDNINVIESVCNVVLINQQDVGFALSLTLEIVAITQDVVGFIPKTVVVNDELPKSTSAGKTVSVVNDEDGPVAPVAPSPVAPLGPVPPSLPVDPVAPSAPLTPNCPVAPVVPAPPGEPEAPVAPVTPVAPSAPLTPV